MKRGGFSEDDFLSMDMRQRHSIVQEIIDQEEIKRLQSKIDICEAVRYADARIESIREYANSVRQEILYLRYGRPEETNEGLYKIFGHKKKKGRKKF